MKQDEFRTQLRHEMKDVHVSPALRRRTLDAAQGKGEQIMKRKMTWALAAALVAVLLCTAALAAVGGWSILDFVGRYPNSYIPEDAQAYVQTDVLSMENEWVTVRIRELYYDGRILRMTADVKPKQEGVLLVGEDVGLEDPFINLTQAYVEGGDNDMRSVWQVMEDEGYTDVYSVNVGIAGTQADMVLGAMDYVLGGDGTLTVYAQEEYAEDLPEREVTISAIVMPFDKPLTAQSQASYEQRDVLQTPVTLEASVYRAQSTAQEGEPANVFVNEAPVEYPDVGVRVDRLLIEVKPQEIYATVAYTVVDREKFAQTENGLWFEFIDPDSKAEAYYDQRLKGGLSGGGSSRPVDGDPDTATHFVQQETLGRNELHDTYTLRAFECWEKQRFETHEFAMRPATAEDAATE